MSTSNPPMAPLDEASSMGGNVGSVQNVNVAARLAPPAVPATAIAAATARIAAIVALMLLSFRPGSRTLTRECVEREQVERDVRRRERRGLARAVVGRRDLDDVAPDEPHAAQRPEERDRLSSRETSHLGSSRSRSERGIEKVDVEREEDGPGADSLAHGLGVPLGSQRAQLLARDDDEAERPRVAEVGRAVQR